jgi:lipoprotein-anchoring transpeptidase ErfK/SrfK
MTEGTGGSPSARPGHRTRPAGRSGAIAAVAALAAAALALSACTSGSHHSGVSPVAVKSTQESSPPPSSSSPAPDAAITTTPAKHTALDPAVPITVTATSGHLVSVKLVNAAGTAVAGTTSPDGTTWRNTEALGYSKTYNLVATAENADGTPVTERSSFTTLTPDNMTMPYLNTIAGQPLTNGGTYGIGIVPDVHFDESIPDKAAAERALQVTVTMPDGSPAAVTGGWNWVSDSDAHWRSEHWLPSGAKVTVSAKVYGVEVGPGLYGQADQSVSFTIGEPHLAIADDATHTVSVYFNGKLQRRMPTSMGQGGYTSGKNGEQIALWTMPGTYTVITHENPATMSSDSYGLPANSPLGYAPEKVYWSTKITVDGIYLHELDATTWAQGNTDVSHGCLNLNYDNAKWYFQTSLVGDIVEVKNVHTVGGQVSAPVQLWQGGDWTVSWADWLKGSALH